MNNANLDNMEPSAPLESAVLADIERDLNDARALLGDSAAMEDGQKYRKAAEIILLKVLHRDSSNTEAKALLATARASSTSLPATVEVAPARPNAFENEQIRFTAAPTSFEKKERKTKHSGRSRNLAIVLAGIVFLAGGVLLFRSTASTQPVASARFAPASMEILDAMPPGASLAGPSVAGLPASTVKTMPASANAAIVTSSSGLAAAASALTPTSAVTPLPDSAPAVEPGSLAVSSPTSADIYDGEKYLGSTPMTLQLPAGRHTLEYRHGDLRSRVTHQIKSKETITAMISFDVTVQINARPWAQVFVEGTTRRALGQTPVSSVKLPIGSVLAFENPNFPSKTRRVTEKDSTIQIVFP